jgi:hypothetical protein
MKTGRRQLGAGVLALVGGSVLIDALTNAGGATASANSDLENERTETIEFGDVTVEETRINELVVDYFEADTDTLEEIPATADIESDEPVPVTMSDVRLAALDLRDVSVEDLFFDPNDANDSDAESTNDSETVNNTSEFGTDELFERLDTDELVIEELTIPFLYAEQFVLDELTTDEGVRDDDETDDESRFEEPRPWRDGNERDEQRIETLAVEEFEVDALTVDLLTAATIEDADVEAETNNEDEDDENGQFAAATYGYASTISIAEAVADSISIGGPVDSEDNETADET